MGIVARTVATKVRLATVGGRKSLRPGERWNRIANQTDRYVEFLKTLPARFAASIFGKRNFYMVWGKRRMAGIEYFPAMDLLEKLQMANAALYREFIMVSVKTSKFGTDDYYVGVPNKALLALFEGFDTVEEAELPKQVTTLHVADVAEFQSRFQFAPDNGP